MKKRKEIKKVSEKKPTKVQFRKAVIEADKNAHDFFEENNNINKGWTTIIEKIFKQNDIEINTETLTAFISGLGLSLINESDLNSLMSIAMSKRHKIRTQK